MRHVTLATRSAEYKQVTVLFADVVHSMDIAAAVGAERLREIMAELADRCAAVVQQYSGTKGLALPVYEAEVLAESHRLRVAASEDAVEGPQAFLEKRDPVWRAR